MRLCPKCGSLTEENSYFGVERCTNEKCDWEDDTVRQMRNLEQKLFSDVNFFKKYKRLIEIILEIEDVEKIDEIFRKLIL